MITPFPQPSVVQNHTPMDSSFPDEISNPEEFKSYCRKHFSWLQPEWSFEELSTEELQKLDLAYEIYSICWKRAEGETSSWLYLRGSGFGSGAMASWGAQLQGDPRPEFFSIYQFLEASTDLGITEPTMGVSFAGGQTAMIKGFAEFFRERAKKLITHHKEITLKARSFRQKSWDEHFDLNYERDIERGLDHAKLGNNRYVDDWLKRNPRYE